MTDHLNPSIDSSRLEEAIDNLGVTANNIADQLVAARKLNRQLVAALLEIAEGNACDCGACLVAMIALIFVAGMSFEVPLNGGTQ